MTGAVRLIPAIRTAVGAVTDPVATPTDECTGKPAFERDGYWPTDALYR